MGNHTENLNVAELQPQDIRILCANILNISSLCFVLSMSTQCSGGEFVVSYKRQSPSFRRIELKWIKTQNISVCCKWISFARACKRSPLIEMIFN